MLSISFLIISNTPFVFLTTASFKLIVSEELCVMIPRSVFWVVIAHLESISVNV